MYKIFLSIASLFLPLLVNAQCPTTDVTLYVQAQVDNFNTTYPSCTAPTKSITINSSTILNLTGLQNITSIGGNLTIKNTGLLNLSGLNNLTQVGGTVDVRMNPSLSTLNGLQNLVSVSGSLTILSNPITSLQGLQNLEYIGGSLDAGGLLTTDLSGMEKVTHLGSLSLIFNNELTSLNGLHNAVASPSWGNIYIYSNDKLADCLIKYICFRRADPPGTIGSTIGSNAPSGNCSESSIDNACLPITLPVSLVYFDAKKSRENQVAITWATSSEKNSKLFQVEKNEGKGTWVSLGTLNAQNESSQTVQYSYADERPMNGTNLYRLKMVDMDDSFAYSRIVAVNFEGIKSNGVYPNPVADRLHLGSDDLAGLLQVQLINTNGQTVLTSMKVEGEGIDVKNLSPGMYMINIKKKDGRVVTYKAFKNKQ